VNNLKSSPSPIFGYDFPLAAKKVWNEMLNPNEYLWNQFKEIIVFENFSIENGLFGLHRDCYLSIVKFLDSSILRKV
jgi:hypothetical protein